MSISRWFRGKRATIQSLTTPHTPQNLSLHDKLLSALAECDLDTLMNNPVAAMSILTLYCSSCHELIQETLTPSRSRALVGVSLYSFFKDSHLPPSLVMQRLASLFSIEPTSNYARFDIDTLITELRDLCTSSSR